MGQSTNATILFGIPFDEGFDFPWEDIDDWWLKVSGFKPSVEIYADTESGYINDVNPDQKIISQYYDEKRIFKENNPLPVHLEHHCHHECPMYILAVPGTVKTAYRGDVEKFDPKDLTVSDEQVKELLEFCKKYGIEHEETPTWCLVSYWG